MQLKTITDYTREIKRVKEAMQKTDSEYLRRDLGKYLKRLNREAKKCLNKWCDEK